MFGVKRVRIIIIGATHTGTAAAAQILALDPTATVTVYERNNNLSFIGAGAPLYLGKRIRNLDALVGDTNDLTQAGAIVKLHHDVLKVNVMEKSVLVQNLNTECQFSDHYDKLVVATGSEVVVPPLVGVDSQKVMLVKDYATTKQVAHAVKSAKKVAIAGGGYIGVELAEALSGNHEVTLYHSHHHLLNHYYDEAMANTVLKLLVAHGVDVRLAEPVTRFTERDHQLFLESGEQTDQFDLALVCTGFVPSSTLLVGQIELDRRGAIVTNEYAQTSDSDVYAAGDVRTSLQNATGKQQYLPQVTNALRQGKIAALHICGVQLADRGTQGTTALSIFEHTYTSTGITLQMAKKQEISAHSVTYRGLYRPSFMDDNAQVMITLVYRTDNHQILGAQLSCTHDVTQSINVVSLAIQNHNTVEDLALLDMFFHPRYNQPVNFLNLVAQKALMNERPVG